MRVILTIGLCIIGALLWMGLTAPFSAEGVSAAEILPATSADSGLSTGQPDAPAVSVRPIYPGLGEFAALVVDGDPHHLVGVYVEGRFALPVAPQPAGQPTYVSEQDGLLTLFQSPLEHGAVGLLAHNYLSGKRFFDLRVNDTVVAVYGDGNSDIFQVARIESYQALDPANPYSQFVDPDAVFSGVMSSTELFDQIYTTPDRLVFQTCVEANGDSSWGRLFVTAEKISSLPIIITE